MPDVQVAHDISSGNGLPYCGYLSAGHDKGRETRYHILIGEEGGDMTQSALVNSGCASHGVISHGELFKPAMRNDVTTA
jgi:hypothetical protein